MNVQEILKTFMEKVRDGFLNLAKTLHDEEDPAQAVEKATVTLTKTIEDVNGEIENLSKSEGDAGDNPADPKTEGDDDTPPAGDDPASEEETGDEPEEIEKKVNAMVEKAITKYVDMFVTADSMKELVADLKAFLGEGISKLTEAVEQQNEVVKKISKTHTSKQVHKVEGDDEEGKGKFGNILG